MIKKILCSMVTIFLIMPLVGCWNYVGLNDLSIISGVAIDKDLAGDNYQLTFEIIDFDKSSTDTGMVSGIVQSKGKTLFEAIRNSKDKLSNRLYWGNAQVIIVGEKVAKEVGMESVIDVLLRAVEPRENLNFAISQETTAAELLTSKGTDHKVIAHLMQNIINKDPKVNGSTERIELYQIFNVLLEQRQSLVLPAFYKRNEPGKEVVEANGVAVFNKDKLIGYLSPEQTKYYLFASDKIESGALAIDVLLPDILAVSFDIDKSKTDFSYRYEKNKLKVFLDINTSVSMVEVMGGHGLISDKFIKKIEEVSAQKLKEKVTDTIKMVQTQYNSDIFGFGLKIYQKNPKLWEKLKKEWGNNIFKNLEFDVKTNITIINTGLIKDK